MQTTESHVGSLATVVFGERVRPVGRRDVGLNDDQVGFVRARQFFDVLVLDLDLVVLGLVYDIEVDGGDVHVVMSLTSPMCPVAEQLVLDAQAAVEGVEGVESCEVDLTFDPPWTPERISPLIRASLGL